jgi:hypothetical protein
MSRILSSLLALGLLVSATTPAHAGWLMKRAEKKARKIAQKAQSALDKERQEREAKMRQDERKIRRQNIIKQVVSTNGFAGQRQIANNLGGRQTPVTLAEKLGGSRRDETKVSALHQMLLRNGNHAGGNFLGFGGFHSNVGHNAVFRNAQTAGNGSSLFSFL